MTARPPSGWSGSSTSSKASAPSRRLTPWVPLRPARVDEGRAVIFPYTILVYMEIPIGIETTVQNGSTALV
jgi:hypothetical protein